MKPDPQNRPVIVDNRFVLGALQLGTFMENPFMPPKSIWGNLIQQGELTIFWGPPYVGKSYLVLQLAIAIARGEPLLGIPTEKARVGILDREISPAMLQERIRQIAGDSTDGFENISIVTKDSLPGGVDVLVPGQTEGIIAWAEGKGLELIIIDALSRIHSGDEISAQDMGRVLGQIDRITETTKAAVLLVHHANRTGEHMSGSRRLFSDPKVELALLPKKDHRVLKNPASNLSERVPDILISGTGGPSHRIDDNEERVLQAVKDGILRPKPMSEVLNLHPKTIQRITSSLVSQGRLVKQGTTTDCSFILP